MGVTGPQFLLVGYWFIQGMGAKVCVSQGSPIIDDDLREVCLLEGDDDFLILLVSLYLNESAPDILLL